MNHQKKIRIQVVCSGNICRSPLAHRVIEKLAAERSLAGRLEVESSGTGAWHVGDDADPRMRKTAAQHGLTLHHRARKTSQRDLVDADILLAMGPDHVRELTSLARRSGIDLDGKLYLLRQFDPDLGATAGTRLEIDRVPEVPDPYYGGDGGFEEVYAIVVRSARVFLDQIGAGALP